MAIPTGFAALDQVLQGGLRPAELAILAGRPGDRKSVLAIQMASTVALGGDLAIFCTMHMSDEQITEQILATTARVPLYRVSLGSLGASDRQNLTEAVDSLSEIPLWMDACDPGMTPPQIQAKVAHIQAERDLKAKLIVVDYVQLMHAASGEDEPKALPPQLKRMAHDLDCAVLALVQLPRAPETRLNQQPTITDLREIFPLIEMEADVITLLYQPSCARNAVRDRVAEVLVTQGPYPLTLTVALQYENEFNRFKDY